MTSLYYYAAHFNTVSAKANQSQVITVPPSKPTPTLSLIGTSVTETPTTRNVFISAAQRHFVPTRAVNEQENSIFFRLPAELRNDVYNELLCARTTTLKGLCQSPHGNRKLEAIHPTILSTCRKMYEEAADLLYTTHLFHAHPSLLTSLPHLTSPARPVVCPSVLSKIKRWRLTIRLDTDPRFTASQATNAFSGAEYLEIRVWQSMFDGCDSSVLSLFTGVRGVKVARVCGSADSELAKWLEVRMMQPIEKRNEWGCCCCDRDRSEARCGQCDKEVNGRSDWFGGRDAWTWGNR